MPLSSAVPASSAKKSCFIWLGEFDLCHSVEKKRKVRRASEFTETYTEPATSEFYHRFYIDYD
jgi:hypothetical protein